MKNAWWNEVSGPSRFIDAAVETAASQKSSILVLPEEIPFEEDFYMILCDCLEVEMDGQDVTVLDGIDGPVAEYFLNKFCKEDLRVKFRPRPGYSEAKFLAESETSTMHGRGFIVRLRDMNELNEWSEFVSEYASSVTQRISPAVFTLVLQSSDKPKAVKGLKQIEYSTYSSHYDAYAYSAIRVSEINEKSIIKTYLAELASNITDDNVEQAEEAIYLYSEFLNDPVAFAQKQFGFKEREPLIKKVWESQLKCIFPHLEKYRSVFLERHRRDIEPMLGTLRDPFGSPYRNIEDIELGSLAHMARTGMIRLESAEYSELENYANARNKLAHISTISYVAIYRLI